MGSLNKNFNKFLDVDNEVCDLNVMVTYVNYGQICKIQSLVVKQTLLIQEKTHDFHHTVSVLH